MKPKRPTSPARAEAARRNGAKSRGPVTVRGKYNSSLNAIRHGLHAKCLLIPGENPDHFREMFFQLHEDIRPRNSVERELVEEIATATWRKQRIVGMEGARITEEIESRNESGAAAPHHSHALCGANAYSSIGKSDRILDKFARYEALYSRLIHRALYRLRQLREDLPGDYDPALSLPDVGRSDLRPLPTPAPDAHVGPPSFTPSLPSRDRKRAADSTPTTVTPAANAKMTHQTPQPSPSTAPPATRTQEPARSQPRAAATLTCAFPGNIIQQMTRRTPVLALALFLTAAFAFAHHSSVMFDRDSEVTMKGTVKEFFFINPHCSITLTVAAPDGKTTDWSFEAASVQGMVRAGWRKSSIKPGDAITIVGHPLRNGEHGAQLVRAVLADGTTLKSSEGGNY